MMAAQMERKPSFRGIDPSFGRLDVHCAAFVSHWLRIRGDDDIPHLEEWAALLPASFATRLFRAELLTDDARVLFLGSELNGDGEILELRSLYANMPHRRTQGVRNMHRVVSSPCGYCFESEHISAEGRSVRTQTVVLPLLTYRSEAPQIVGFSAALQRKAAHAGLIVGMKLRVTAKWWLNVGSGVPGTPPS